MATTEERARLSRETVVDGALALTDTEGLEGLTIRRLATHLGVTPMALYWHFKNKDELLDGVADRLWSLVDTEVDQELPWSVRLRSLMDSMVEVLRSHPQASSLLMTTQPDASVSCFAIMEVALETLASAGFSPAESAAICRHGLRTVTTLAVGDSGLKPQQTADEAAEFIRHKRIALETLPRNRYPCVIEAAGPLSEIENPDAYFAFGIDLFVSGVEALAARKAGE
ncbi:TetR family transcriptional regulator [Actinomadura sp. DC4]|uniref:TetR family transcriptional regulator n=1 Tax=Actinomadura sp. DC4 TaxID=3055069 RepID=UPI0025B0F5B8|nr:TetR family transcriptional regulator [Actinomadura sp. DC4]MDN3355937.1 TetR family transcriptional regulator [Actinomadura sp. DC4]